MAASECLVRVMRITIPGKVHTMSITQARQVAGPKVRYAVVGLGWISQAAFLPGVAHTGNSEITAFVTDHEAKALEVGKEYGNPKVYSYDQLGALLASGEIDAVYLATPNFDHVEYAVQYSGGGRRTCCSKSRWRQA